MNENISHPGQVFPRNFGILASELIRNMFCRLSDYLQGSDDGKCGLVILYEFFIIHLGDKHLRFFHGIRYVFQIIFKLLLPLILFPPVFSPNSSAASMQM